MVKTTLSQKFYGSKKIEAFQQFQTILHKELSNIKVKVKNITMNRRGWIQVEIIGEDEIAAVNYLKSKFGKAHTTLDGLCVPSTMRGRVISPRKVGNGICVDIGVSSPEMVDALIPRNKLCAQLTNGMKHSIDHIINHYCLHEYFPLEILLTKVDFKKNRIEAELSESQRKTFIEWINFDFERIVILGSTLKQVEHAIRRSKMGHFIIKIDKLGFLEHSIICKLGVDAPGIIAKIGRFLFGVPLCAFSPKKLRKS